MDVFALFANSDYKFLKISQRINGNVIEKEYSGRGIARLIESFSESDNVEQKTSESTLHVRTDEPFVSELQGDLVGNGVSITNIAGKEVTYRITEASQAPDYDEGNFPFYRLVLKKEDIAPWPSALPLS